MPDYEKLRNKRKWQVIEQVNAGDCRVGVMGLGQLGSACANALQALGYTVNGYSRTEKHLPGVSCFAGGQLDVFLAQTDILVCLLPLTDATRHILSEKTFKTLPEGASVINVGRGGHLNELDLLSALDSGQLSHAVLDVFETEPLPDDHPFWTHPDITITPHIASQTVAASAVNHIVDGIRCHRQGRPLEFLYDPKRGY